MAEATATPPAEKEKPKLVFGNEKEAIKQASDLTAKLAKKKNGEDASPYKVYKIGVPRRIEKGETYIVGRSPAAAMTTAGTHLGLSCDRTDVPAIPEPDVYVGLIDDAALAVLKDAIAQREAETEENTDGDEE